MEELFDLAYKDEVDLLRDEPDFEALGDEKYTHHSDMQARLYWAFCRPSGSSIQQIKDPHPLVSIMAFNHSRLGALQRFTILHPDVIANDDLRIKIVKRSRMLFRDLVDHDFHELNAVLDLVPVFTDMAVDQLINGRKWNDIPANSIEATKFLSRTKEFYNEKFFNAFYNKLADFEEFDAVELKNFLQDQLERKTMIDPIILEYYMKKALEWTQDSDLHILQKKGLEKLAKSLQE